MRWFSCFLFVFAAALAPARDFSVLVYNVENLMDLDGVTPFEDYQPARYTRAHFQTKVENIAALIAKLDGGKGPDVILFAEIELDFTPDKKGPDYDAFTRRFSGVKLADMLGSRFTAEIADLPSEWWIAKALHERGVSGYTIIPADQQPAKDTARSIAQKNVVFTRFPVKESRTLRNEGARDTLEVVIEVEGHPLHLFANHWKSGASDPATEPIRVANARVLRTRLDEIFAADRNADVILGGDFNSQYNQKARYGREMKVTAINDVLKSQGNELAVRGTRDLYNLWFELPIEQRGSDTYRGEWGTLMQLIISRGLYDYRGVQYVDNSFALARLPGVNADAAGVPIRWSFDGSGSGYSDHLPIFARFRTVADNKPDKWLALTKPNEVEAGDETARKIDYGVVDTRGTALTAAKLPAGADLRDGSYNGKLFLVDGEISATKFSVEAFGATYEVYAPDKAVRDAFWEGKQPGQRVKFYGELGTFRGRWQFVIKDASWLKP